MDPATGGSGYIFEREGDDWIQKAKLVAPGVDLSDGFGFDAAIHGDVAVLSAYNDDDLGGNAGAVYVFRRTGSDWNLEQKLTASDAHGQHIFGSDVAIYGNTIVVGADHDQSSGPYLSGAGYVFEYDGGSWHETQKLTANVPHQWQQLGYSVDIEGGRIVLGGQASAGEDRPGEVVVFEKNNSQWVETGVLRQGDGAPAEGFGSFVDLSGSRVLAGAPNHESNGGAYVFDAGGDAGDTFVVGGGSGNDTITDFEVGIDRLQLQGSTTIAGYREIDANNDGRLDTIADLSDGGSVTMLGVRGLAPPQTVEKIVFASNADGDFDIWAMNPDGSNRQQLINLPGHTLLGDVSPDGRKLTFFNEVNGRNDVYLYDLETGQMTNLTATIPGGAAYGVFSPDGSTIAITQQDSEIYTMPVTGGAPIHIPTSTSAHKGSLDWGSDGNIYYMQQTSGWSIGRVDPVTGQSSLLISGAPYVYSPAVSDDGTKLAYSRYVGATTAVPAIADTDGQHSIDIAAQIGGTEQNVQDFSPDGSHVLIAGQGYRFYTLDLATNQLQLVGSTSATDITGEWARIASDYLFL